MGCLSEKELSSYLDKKISGAERRKIEEHVAGCNACLDMLLVARDAERREKTEKTKRRGRGETKWLLGALILFLCSFVVKRYFLQFLAASAVLGFKWAMEGEGARRAIMIFKDFGRKQDSVNKDRDRTLDKAGF
ncbi:MAG: zf-HC2 domain-containing protein [Candidatus Omnitrophota bacterium]